MATSTLNPLSNQSTGDASAIVDAWLDDLSQTGSGVINAGNYNTPNLKTRHFTKQISVTINGPATFDGKNLPTRTFWSVEAPQKWIGKLEFKNFGNSSIFNACPALDGDGTTGGNWFDAIVPSWTKDMDHFILDGLSFNNVLIPVFFSSTNNFRTYTTADFKQNHPRIKKIQIRNCTVRNSGGGFSFIPQLWGESKTISEIQTLVDNQDWDNIPVLLVNNLMEDIDCNRQDVQSGGGYTIIAGSPIRLGRHDVYAQHTNGGLYIANNTFRRIFESRIRGAEPGVPASNDNNEGAETQGIRLLAGRGGIVENNYFRSIRNIRPLEYNATANNEAIYTKYEDFVFRNNDIINCGRREGTITFKSGKRPEEIPDFGNFDPDNPTQAQLDYGLKNPPSGRRNSIVDNTLIYDGNIQSFMPNDTRGVRSPSSIGIDTSEVKRNKFYGWVNWINSNTNTRDNTRPGGSVIWTTRSVGDEVSDNEFFENSPSPLPSPPAPIDLGGSVTPDPIPPDPPPIPDPEPVPAEDFPQIESVTETSVSTPATSHAANLPATIDANDLLILVATMNFNITGGDTLDSVVDSTGDTWTKLYEAKQTIHCEAPCYYKIADGDEDGGTVTLTTSDICNMAAQVYRISNWYEDAAGIEFVTNQVGSSAINPFSLTASWGVKANLWFSFLHGTDDDVTITTGPSGFSTPIQTVSGGGQDNGAEVASTYLASGVSALDPSAWILEESEALVTSTIVIRPSDLATEPDPEPTPDPDPGPEPDPEPEPPAPDPEPDPQPDPDPPLPEKKPPIANFEVDFKTGEVPLSVNFTDLSGNSPSNWDWDFGDGSISTLQNPEHQYTSTGFYTVTLIVANPDGQDTETKVAYIEVTETPPEPPPPPPAPSEPPSEGQVRRAKVVRTTTMPVLITTEDGEIILTEQVGGPDPETIDGPDLFIILEQGQNPEGRRDPGIRIRF